MSMRASRRSRFVVLCVIVVMLVVVGPLALRAGPFTTGPLVQVSTVNPFAACTADDVAGQIARDPSGQRTVFLNSEVEPWVDVNPTNPNNIVAFWQQDRWSDGGSRGLVAGVTTPWGRSLLVRMGAPVGRNVTPWSNERLSERLNGPAPARLLAPRISSKNATRVPSGRTRSWLPIVCEMAPGS